MIKARFDSKRHSVFTIARHKYFWPGGSLMLAVMDDGECLCPDCVKENAALIARSIREPQYRTGWGFEGVQSAEMLDSESPEYCAHCNRDLATL